MWLTDKSVWSPLIWNGSRSYSTHRDPGKKAIKVLVRPGREANFKPSSTETDALPTRSPAVVQHFMFHIY